MSEVDQRILILTSTQKDSESTSKILSLHGLQPYVCVHMDSLIANIKIGAGALLIAKEALVSPNQERLNKILNEQESWSDLPLVVLASTGDLTEGNSEAIKMLRLMRNTTVLERPVRVATMISILESAIANRKRQYEVRKLLRELVSAHHDAHRANRTKSEFLANMSHEIRTPLGVMLGFAEFARDEKIGAEERRRYLEAIEKNGRVLLDIVNDILDLAKVEAGHVAIEKIEAPVADILKEVVSGFKPAAKEKKLSIDLTLAPDFPARLKTDPTRIRQIFTNVVGNAVKFTEAGSIVCNAGFREVDEQYEVVLTVTDTGLGISETQLKKLFRPFSQADSSMARKYGGTGLGLVLSKKLAVALGGDLRVVQTQLGKGSTFEITFTAEPVESSREIEADHSKGAPYSKIAGMRVLLAEDSPDNQFIISRYLEQVGIEVKVADNGEQAIDFVSHEHFDAILMDIQMPRMDGNEATMILRQNGYASPIIALTANALKGDREKALISGFDDYITKPIERAELYDSLSRFDQRGHHNNSAVRH